MPLVTADDVRNLLASEAPGATLVLVEGEVRILAGAEVTEERYAAVIVVADRDQLRKTANLDVDDPSDDALRELAERLDAAVSHLGG
jgi:hypothetical protein